MWHPGLLFKLKQILPYDLYVLLQSYLTDRTFVVRINNSYSKEHEVLASVPQGSVLGPLLYSIYTADLPTCNQTILATFADDIAILASNSDVRHANSAVQNHLNRIVQWAQRWRIQFNPHKCQHITFTNRSVKYTPIIINNNVIPQVDFVRYLGMYLDRRLTWRFHVAQTRKAIVARARLLHPLLGRRSTLYLKTKRRIYLTMIAPIWRYGIELYGSTSASNLNRIQQQQSKILRVITSAPFYVSNLTLHNDLNISFVRDTYIGQYGKLFNNFKHSSNPNIARMHSSGLPGNPAKRLRRKWCRDALPIT